MRLKVRSLQQAVKRDLPIEFVPQRLTSYGGLELVRRYCGGSGSSPGCAPRSRRSRATTAVRGSLC